MPDTLPPPNPELVQNDPVIEDITEWRINNGFEKGHHGTYWNADKTSYFYEKDCHRVNTEGQAQKSVRVARYLTEKGLFHPSTMWRIGNRGNVFQLVATTPAISAWSPGTRELDEVFEGDSHIKELVQKIDPEVNLPERPNANSLVWLLNFSELLHDDNWGTDPKTGMYYPIDVEALNLEGSESMLIVEQWDAGVQSSLSS